MGETSNKVKENVIGAIGGIVVITLLLAMLFGGLTCGIRVIGGEESYNLWLYRNGVQTGDFTTHHDNGEVSSIQPYSNGKINGEARYFDDEGRLTESITHKNGIRNGPYTLYHPNGEVRERGENFSGGKMESSIRRFDVEGKPLDL